MRQIIGDRLPGVREGHLLHHLRSSQEHQPAEQFLLNHHKQFRNPEPAVIEPYHRESNAIGNEAGSRDSRGLIDPRRLPPRGR